MCVCSRESPELLPLQYINPHRVTSLTVQLSKQSYFPCSTVIHTELLPLQYINPHIVTSLTVFIKLFRRDHCVGD